MTSWLDGWPAWFSHLNPHWVLCLLCVLWAPSFFIGLSQTVLTTNMVIWLDTLNHLRHPIGLVVETYIELNYPWLCCVYCTAYVLCCLNTVRYQKTLCNIFKQHIVRFSWKATSCGHANNDANVSRPCHYTTKPLGKEVGLVGFTKYLTKTPLFPTNSLVSFDLEHNFSWTITLYFFVSTWQWQFHSIDPVVL